MDPGARRPGGFGRRSGMGKYKNIEWESESVKDVIDEMHRLACNTSYNTRRKKYKSEVEKVMRRAACGMVHMYANRLVRARERLFRAIGVTAMRGYWRGTVNDKDMALLKIAKLCETMVAEGFEVKK